ncbi:GNAT family N-acetyltransferase [Actibacterium ureilyticum]|uniref:GNAT family N-acetyltransferase n=1 Tax=Actibacterium ureilyticum TaxID=1590614 RepID=UPI000BAAB94D|nr:GNAT family N-acetyltransferase [Actibacterium ureilyticum]
MICAKAPLPWEAAPQGAPDRLAALLVDRVPQLDTARLVLRAPVIGDFDSYAAIMMSDRAVHMDGPLSRRDAWLDFTQYVAGWLLRGCGMWTVVAREDTRVLGFVSVAMAYGDRAHELGYLFRPDAGGRGFATEAVRAARDYAFGAMGLSTLVSYVAPENTRSIALAQRLGAKPDEAAAAELDDDCRVFRHSPDGGM